MICNWGRLPDDVTPSSLRDFDKLIRIITTQPVTNVVLLQNVRAPSTVPKSVVKPCSNYVEGWVLQSPLSAALLLALIAECCMFPLDLKFCFL